MGLNADVHVQIAAWAAGDVSDERAFRMMAWAFAGFGEDEMLAFSEETQRATLVREPVTWRGLLQTAQAPPTKTTPATPAPAPINHG